MLSFRLTRVAVVPDGIAGIFRTNAYDERVVLKSRKGIARLALRTGHAIVPAYSIGNTAAFSAFFDPWGVMERVSRKVQGEPRDIPTRSSCCSVLKGTIMFESHVSQPRSFRIGGASACRSPAAAT